jgi:sterol 14-demethylase
MISSLSKKKKKVCTFSISVCSSSFTETDFKTVSVHIMAALTLHDEYPTVMPTLFSDISRVMDDWGAEGIMNPFKDIYDIVFQMTVRMATCKELASDPRMIQKMNDLYWKLEKSATPVGLLLPWFPGTAKKNKEQATRGLYDMLSHYVDIRRKAEVPNSDAIDLLIADGLDDPSIIGVCVILLFS